MSKIEWDEEQEAYWAPEISPAVETPAVETPTASPVSQGAVATVRAVLRDGTCVLRLMDGSEAVVRDDAFPRLTRGAQVVVFQDELGHARLSAPVEAEALDQEVEGTIMRRVQGGLLVRLWDGRDAFLPGSLADLRLIRDFSLLLGQTCRFKVVSQSVTPNGRVDIVVSRRALLEEERARRLATLAVGQIVEGEVKQVLEYGAFLALEGGVSGLLHVREMSWGRVTDPADLLKPGERVRVKVLGINTDSKRVTLGLKQLTEDPWQHAALRYPPGTVVSGKVVVLKDYGAFIEIEPGVEGLIHLSELSWQRRIKHPSKLLAKGQTVTAVVLEIDQAKRQFSLSMKKLTQDPFEKLQERIPPGQEVRGPVRSVADFGVFVDLDEVVDGLVHIREMSWIWKDPTGFRVFQKGETLEAVVLSVAPHEKDRYQIALGLKQRMPDPWDRLPAQYPPGRRVRVPVRKVLAEGLVVDLEPGLFTLVFWPEWLGQALRAGFSPGQEVTVEVVLIDAAARNLVLALAPT